MFKLLLVEDDDLVRRAMVRRLKSLCEVVAVENGQRGIETLRAEHFDFIVSDLDMPIMNGAEFLKHVKREFPNFLPRFVFLTGRPDAAEGLGVTVLEKLDVPELIDLVKAAIGVGSL